MKIVIQRSLCSSVSVDKKVIGQIEKGMVLLICCEKGDNKESAQKAIKKLMALRIFQDENGRMNKNIIDTGGQVLAISQFTLSWDGKKGNRPSFENSMAPDEAKSLFDYFCNELKSHVELECGEFGANMQVHIENDGPVTFSLEF